LSFFPEGKIRRGGRGKKKERGRKVNPTMTARCGEDRKKKKKGGKQKGGGRYFLSPI